MPLHFSAAVAFVVTVLAAADENLLALTNVIYASIVIVFNTDG